MRWQVAAGPLEKLTASFCLTPRGRAPSSHSLDRYGAGGDEMDMKGQHEQALRVGQCTVAVFAPADERKRLAADIRFKILAA